MSGIHKVQALKRKLAVGTVQFGMPYGINGKAQVSPEEAVRILDYGASEGALIIDTASVYGSEELVGEYVRNHTARSVVSKIQATSRIEAQQVLAESLQHNPHLYGYLIHRFEQHQQVPEIYDLMLEAKREGRIDKVGFSLYYPHELDYLFEQNIPIDLVQLPMSVFDRRFVSYLPQLASRGIEVHIRSVFLQGLVFKQPDSLSEFFNSARASLELIHQIAKESGLPIVALAVGWVLLHPEVSAVVIGVHDLEQFKQIVAAAERTPLVAQHMQRLTDVAISEEDLLVPARWP